MRRSNRGKTKLPRPNLKNQNNNNSNKNKNAGAKTEVIAPTAVGNCRVMAEPQFLSQGTRGDITVRHREYISDLHSSVLFEASGLVINPGLFSTFPWLSGIATRFESYRFKRLDFFYETESPTNQVGAIMLAIDYDVTDPPPQSKIQMMSYRNSVRGPPWSSFAFRSSREDLSKRSSYFVRNGSYNTSDEAQLYDVGVVYAAAQGQTTPGVVLGELYVDYEIELMTPQLSTSTGLDTLSATFAGTVNTLMFGGSIPIAGWPQNTLQVSYAPSGTTGSIFTFNQPFQGLWTIDVDGTGLTTISVGGTSDDHEISELVLVAGTSANSFGYIRATVGQTFLVTIPNTTITSAQCYFTEMNVPQIPSPKAPLSLITNYSSDSALQPGRDTEVSVTSCIGRKPIEGSTRCRRN